MAIISVFGHENPDNDAISAAVGAAYLMTNIDQENEYVPVRLGDMPKETQWVADTYGYAAPEYVASVADLPHEEGCKPKVFLVDHNESTQSIDGLADADVVGIIDHHRIGDVQTAGPIYVTCRPWGSSSTVITTLLEQAGLDIPVPIAAALLSALLTDTIIMRSPTTTQSDCCAMSSSVLLSGSPRSSTMTGMLSMKSKPRSVSAISWSIWFTFSMSSCLSDYRHHCVRGG
jgi:manganese-dependent inorganic pyrophosphatase